MENDLIDLAKKAGENIRFYCIECNNEISLDQYKKTKTMGGLCEQHEKELMPMP